MRDIATALAELDLILTTGLFVIAFAWLIFGK